MINRLSACGLLLVLMTFAARLPAQPGSTPPESDADEPDGRRVFVPIEDLDVVLEHDKQGVILSKAEFLKLAAEAKAQLDKTPVLCRRLSFQASSTRRGSKTINWSSAPAVDLDQFARGWQTVTLPYRGLAVEAATLDDKPAKIGRGTGEGRPLVVMTQQMGKHLLNSSRRRRWSRLAATRSPRWDWPPSRPQPFKSLFRRRNTCTLMMCRSNGRRRPTSPPRILWLSAERAASRCGSPIGGPSRIRPRSSSQARRSVCTWPLKMRPGAP